jgi:hypothetical protein
MKAASGRTLSGILIAALTLCAAAPAAAQTVTTDLPDYMPEWTVIIAGSGWLPGETVSLLIQENPPNNVDLSISAVADDRGDFVSLDFVVPPNAWGTAYAVTAAGQTSLATARTTFTDGIAQGSLCAAITGHGATICASATGATGVLNNTHYKQQAGTSATYEIIGAVGGTVGWQVAGGGRHKLCSVRASGASQYGIFVTSGKNSVNWNSLSGNAVGLRVTGAGNDLGGGTIALNTGDGAQIAGSSNSFQGAMVQSNGGHGFQASGTGNTIQSNTSQGNGRDGFNVTGATNLLQSNTANKNSGDGFVIAATGNKVQNNQSNTSGPGGTNENKGYEYRLIVGASNVGGNRADGIAIPKTTAPTKCPTFPAAGVCE